MTTQEVLSVVAGLLLIVLSWLLENWRILTVLGIGVAALIGILVIRDRVGYLEQSVRLHSGKIKAQQEELDGLAAKVDELSEEVRAQGEKLDDLDEKVDGLGSAVSDLAGPSSADDNDFDHFEG